MPDIYIISFPKVLDREYTLSAISCKLHIWEVPNFAFRNFSCNLFFYGFEIISMQLFGGKRESWSTRLLNSYYVYFWAKYLSNVRAKYNVRLFPDFDWKSNYPTKLFR